MTAKVLESFGGKFAEQWVATLFTPAFAFWLGGFIAVVQRQSWPKLVTQFTQIPEPLQITILVGCLCVVAASAFVVQRFDLAVLRFLEGYGCLWLRPIRRWRINHYRRYKDKISHQNQALRATEYRYHEQRDKISKQIQALTAIESNRKVEFQILRTRINLSGDGSLNQNERDRYFRLNQQLLTSDEQETLIRLRQELANQLLTSDEENTLIRLGLQLRAFPTDRDLMPTRLGNLLRAAERKPLEKYGLDAVICWPRLWLLLPDAVRKDLQEARADLNIAARVWFWSLLFIFWVLLGAWWAVPVGLLSAAFVYYGWLLDAAGTYADLLESAFDLYRPLLYQSLRWPLPNSPQEEHQSGEALTQYLWRGAADNPATFVPPK
jgi:hypothetical protein